VYIRQNDVSACFHFFFGRDKSDSQDLILIFVCLKILIIIDFIFKVDFDFKLGFIGFPPKMILMLNLLFNSLLLKQIQT